MRLEVLAFPKAQIFDNDPDSTAWARCTADQPMLADFGAGMTAQPLMPGPEIDLIGAYWE